MNGRTFDGTETNIYDEGPRRATMSTPRVIPLCAVRRKTSKDMSSDPNFEAQMAKLLAKSSTTTLSSSEGSDFGYMTESIDGESLDYDGVMF